MHTLKRNIPFLFFCYFFFFLCLCSMLPLFSFLALKYKKYIPLPTLVHVASSSGMSLCAAGNCYKRKFIQLVYEGTSSSYLSFVVDIIRTLNIYRINTPHVSFLLLRRDRQKDKSVFVLFMS